MDLEIYVYLEDFYDIYISSNVKTYPLMNFKSLVSDIQLALLYSSIIVG
jgi:hypothetical protein